VELRARTIFSGVVIISLVLVQRRTGCRAWNTSNWYRGDCRVDDRRGGIAYKFANQDALRENESASAVKEVGSFSSAFFATMCRRWICWKKHAGDLGIATVRQFYWQRCALERARQPPTYLNFLHRRVSACNIYRWKHRPRCQGAGRPGVVAYIIASR